MASSSSMNSNESTLRSFCLTGRLLPKTHNPIVPLSHVCSTMTAVHAAPVGCLPPPGASPAARRCPFRDPRTLPRTRHPVAVADRRSLRLSTRVTVFFGLIAMLAGLSLTALTYTFPPSSAVNQRPPTAKAQAYGHATELVAVLDQPAETRERMQNLTIESGGFAGVTGPPPSHPVGGAGQN